MVDDIMGGAEAQLGVTTEGEPGISSLTAKLDDLKSNAGSVQGAIDALGTNRAGPVLQFLRAQAQGRSPSGRGRPARQDAASIRSFSEIVAEQLGWGINRAVRAPFAVMNATGKALGRTMVSTAGSFGQVTRQAGPTAIAVTGMGLALGGLLSPIARFAAGLKVLQLSFGWAEDAAQKTITAAGRAARFAPGASAIDREAATEEYRIRAEQTAAIYGPTWEQVESSITRQMRRGTREGGGRGNPIREAFRSIGYTQDSIKRFENEAGGIDLLAFGNTIILLREDIERRMRAAVQRGDTAEAARLEGNLRALGKVVQQIGQGTTFADVVSGRRSEDIARVQQAIRQAAGTGARPGALGLAQQYQAAQGELRTIFGNLREDIGSTVQPAIIDFLSAVNRIMRDTKDGGLGLSRSLAGVAAQMANSAWGALEKQLKKINHDTVHGWLKAIERWSKEGGPERAATTIRAVAVGLGYLALGAKELWETGKDIIHIFEQLREVAAWVAGGPRAWIKGLPNVDLGGRILPDGTRRQTIDIPGVSRPFWRAPTSPAPEPAPDAQRPSQPWFNVPVAGIPAETHAAQKPVAALAEKTDRLDTKITDIGKQSELQAKQIEAHAADVNTAQTKTAHWADLMLGQLSREPLSEQDTTTIRRGLGDPNWKELLGAQRQETDRTQAALNRQAASDLTVLPRDPQSKDAREQRAIVDRIVLHDEEIGLNAEAAQRNASQLSQSRKSIFETLKSLVASIPSEAPRDGKPYVRKNRAWSKLLGGDAGAGGGGAFGGHGASGGWDAGGGGSASGGVPSGGEAAASVGGGATAGGGSLNLPAGTGVGIDRSAFVQELRQKPGLRERLLDIAYNEQGSNPQGTQAVLESMMNRAQVRGTNLERQARWTGPERGYYERGNMGRGKEPHRATLERSLANTLAGSNISNFAYGNASQGTAQDKITGRRGITATPTFRAGGETFFGPNSDEPGYVRSYASWRQRAQAQIAAAGGRSQFAGGGGDPGISAVRANTDELKRINEGVTTLGQPMTTAQATPQAAQGQSQAPRPAAAAAAPARPAADPNGPWTARMPTAPDQQQAQGMAMAPQRETARERQAFASVAQSLRGLGAREPSVQPQPASSFQGAREALQSTAAGRAMATSAEVQQTPQGPVLNMRMDQAQGAPGQPAGAQQPLGQLRPTQENTQELRQINQSLQDFSRVSRAVQPGWGEARAAQAQRAQAAPATRVGALPEQLTPQPASWQTQGEPQPPGTRARPAAQSAEERSALLGGIKSVGQVTGLNMARDLARREGRIPEGAVPQPDLAQQVTAPPPVMPRAFTGSGAGTMTTQDGEAFGTAAADALRTNLDRYAVGLRASATSQSVPPRSVPKPTGGDMPTES